MNSFSLVGQGDLSEQNDSQLVDPNEDDLIETVNTPPKKKRARRKSKKNNDNIIVYKYS